MNIYDQLEKVVDANIRLVEMVMKLEKRVVILEHFIVNHLHNGWEILEDDRRTENN